MAKCYSEVSQDLEMLTMSTDSVHFNSGGSLTLILHGIKNDRMRDGFEVSLRPASNLKVDPIATLRYYIERTKF